MATKRIERKDLVAPDAITSVIDETVKLEAQLTKVVSINKELLKTNPLKSTEDVKNFNKDIQSTVKSTESLAKVTKQLNSQTDEEVRGRIRLQRAQRQQRDTLKDLVVLEDREAGTLEKLNARNRQLRRERAGLNLETEKGVKRLKEINKQLDANNKQIKDNADQLKKQRLNVGNYTESIQEAASGLEFFGINIGNAGTTLANFAMNPLALATAGLTALSALYASSTLGSRDLARATNTISTVIGTFGDRLARIVGTSGEGGILNQFTKGWSILIAAFTGDLGLIEAVFTADQAFETLDKLRVEQAKVNKQQEELRFEAEKLRNVRDDDALKLTERIAANEKLLEVINKRSRIQEEVLEKRIRATRNLLSTDSENRDLQIELLNLEAELNNVREDNEGLRAEQLANVNSLTNEGNALIKERIRLVEEQNKKFKEFELGALAEDEEDPFFKEAQAAIKKDTEILKSARETEEKKEELAKKGIEARQKDKEFEFNQDIEREKRREEKLREVRNETIEQVLTTIDTVSQALDAVGEKRLTLINNELEETQRASDRQAELAARGLDNTLAFEEKKAAELERRREQEAERQERRQKVLAYLAQFTELSKSDANSAAVKAAANVAIAEAVSGLFYEGTEKVEDDIAGKPFFPGRDGYLVRVDGSERIMTGEQNRRIGNISNEDLANIAEAYNKGQLINYGINDKNIIRELQEVRKGLSQVSTHIEIDKDGIVTRRDLKNGLKKISRKHPPRI